MLLLVRCSPSGVKQREGKLKVVTTTGMIYDAVINIAGDSVDAEALMGPGVDPHLYKATQGDLSKITSADLVLYNGLYLEGKMEEILERFGKQRPVVPLAAAIDTTKLRASATYQDEFDPHVWFDVSLWKEVVNEASLQLQKHDSLNSELYKKNTDVYLTKLDSLHKAVKEQTALIPEEHRILVTSHDAFGYFGDAYNIRVEGLQGISTVSEPGLKDISAMVDLIVETKVKAVFVETSVSAKSINAVVQGCKERGHDVVIGGSLYSDAMGEFGTFEGTYLGMVDSNVRKIVNALK